MKSIMKKGFIGLMVIVMWQVSAVSWAEPVMNTVIMDRIITLRNWKLMQEFNLSGQKAQQVFSILDKLDSKRVELVKQRKNILKRIRQEVANQFPDKKVLEGLISDYLEVMDRLGSMQKEEIKALDEVFTVREQARYLLFSQNIAREVRRLMHGRSNRKPRIR